MTRRAAVESRPILEQEPIRPLADHEFEQIRRLAHRVFGLDLRPGKEELVASRLGRLVRKGGFPSFQDYYRHIVEDKTGESLAHMIDALATNHTAFLREPDHFEFLRDELLPQLSRRDAVEVWSAACSTGEEVWTLACVVSGAGIGRARIVGSDISTTALRFAARAEYGVDRCAGLPAAWLARHFEPVGHPPSAYRVAPAMRGLATFRRCNLIEPPAWSARFPVIFCRNVMIYFDAPTQERVVHQLAQCLEPGGHLFVGHAESLNRIRHGLEYVRPAIYRKPLERKRR